MYFCRRRCEPTAAYSIAPPETMLSVYADGRSIRESRKKTAQPTPARRFFPFTNIFGEDRHIWIGLSNCFQSIFKTTFNWHCISWKFSYERATHSSELRYINSTAPWWYSSRRGLASRVGWCKCKVIVCALLGMPKPWESNYEPLQCCLTLDGPSGRENLRHDLVLSDARWVEHQRLCSVLLTTFWWFRLMP